MSRAAEKQFIIDEVMDALQADKLITDEQHQRLWDALTRLTSADLFLLKLAIMKRITAEKNKSEE